MSLTHKRLELFLVERGWVERRSIKIAYYEKTINTILYRMRITTATVMLASKCPVAEAVKFRMRKRAYTWVTMMRGNLSEMSIVDGKLEGWVPIRQASRDLNPLLGRSKYDQQKVKDLPKMRKNTSPMTGRKGEWGGGTPGRHSKGGRKKYIKPLSFSEMMRQAREKRESTTEED